MVNGLLPFEGPRVEDVASSLAGPLLYGHAADNGYTAAALAALATGGVIRRIESCA
jgi:hypothetical protein